MRKNSHNHGMIALLVAGFFYALQAIFPKYLSQFLGAYETITIRFIIAFILVAIISLYTKDISFKNIGSSKKSLIVYALAFPASAILFTLAVFHTKVSLAIFSFYIANVLSSFIVGKLFFKEKISKDKLISLMCILVALVLFTKPFSGFSLDMGFLIGLLSGVIQTLAFTFQKNIKEAVSFNTLLFLQTGISSLIGIIVILVTKSPIHFFSLPPKGIVVACLYGMSFALVSALFIYGFRRVKLSIGTVMISSELFFGPLLAFFIFAERLSPLEILGGIATIAAIIYANRSES